MFNLTYRISFFCRDLREFSAEDEVAALRAGANGHLATKQHESEAIAILTLALDMVTAKLIARTFSRQL